MSDQDAEQTNQPSDLLKALSAYANERQCSTELNKHFIYIGNGTYRLAHANWANNDTREIERRVFGQHLTLLITDTPYAADEPSLQMHKPENIANCESPNSMAIYHAKGLEDGKQAIDTYLAALNAAEDEPWLYKETRLTIEQGSPQCLIGPDGRTVYHQPPHEVVTRYLTFLDKQPHTYDETTNVTGFGIASSIDTLKPRRGRGQAINIQTPFLIGTDHATRALTSALFKPESGVLKDDGTYLWDNPAGNRLDVSLIPDLDNIQGLVASDFVKHLDVLSLKTLFGAMRAWADQTGATRYSDYADIPLSTLMKASGYQSNPYDQIQKNYISAFLVLGRCWVQVPDQTDYAQQHKKPKTAWQRIINSDQISASHGLFADDPNFRTQDVWAIRFHPAEFIFNTFYGKDSGQRQFAKIAETLLSYDTAREGSALKLGFYYSQLKRLHYGPGDANARQLTRAKKGSLLTLNASTVCEATGIIPNSKNLGEWIERFKRWHSKLMDDQIITKIELLDPGEDVSPKKRFQQIKVRIYPD